MQWNVSCIVYNGDKMTALLCMAFDWQQPCSSTARIER